MRTLVIGCGTVACKIFSRRTVRTAISRLGVSSSPSKTGAPRRPTSCPAPSVTSVLPVSDQQLFEAVTALWPRASNVTQLKRSSRRRVPLGRRQCRAPAPSRRASAAWKHFTWLATRSFARWRRQANRAGARARRMSSAACARRVGRVHRLQGTRAPRACIESTRASPHHRHAAVATIPGATVPAARRRTNENGVDLRQALSMASSFAVMARDHPAPVVLPSEVVLTCTHIHRIALRRSRGPADNGARATGRARPPDRHAAGVFRHRSGIAVAHRDVPANARAAGMEGGPQRSHRLSLGGRRSETTGAARQGPDPRHAGRGRGGKHAGRRSGETGEPDHADHLHQCRQPDRQRPRGELHASGRKPHRLHQLRPVDGRQVDGAIEGASAATRTHRRPVQPQDPHRAILERARGRRAIPRRDVRQGRGRGCGRNRAGDRGNGRRTRRRPAGDARTPST